MLNYLFQTDTYLVRAQPESRQIFGIEANRKKNHTIVDSWTTGIICPQHFQLQ